MAGMYSKMAGRKIGKVMREGMAGKLHAGKTGKIVKDPAQMKAIALSEARKRGLKVPMAPKVSRSEKRLAGKKF